MASLENKSKVKFVCVSSETFYDQSEGHRSDFNQFAVSVLSLAVFPSLQETPNSLPELYDIS